MAVQAKQSVEVEAHLARIDEDGYTIVRGAIEPELTVALRDAVRRVFTELDVQPKGNRAEGEHILGYMRDRAAAHGVDAPVFRIAAANVQTYEAVRGAPIAEEGEDFPLVLFSHANGALRMQSTYLTVPLASHGFVVAAPDHAGNTLTELLASDEVDVGAQLLSFQDRPRDLGVVLDALLRAQVAPKIAAVSLMVSFSARSKQISQPSRSCGPIGATKWRRTSSA